MGVQSLYLGTVLTAGLLSFFSPCIVPLLPVYLSMFSSGGPSGAESPARAGCGSYAKAFSLSQGFPYASFCWALVPEYWGRSSAVNRS